MVAELQLEIEYPSKVEKECTPVLKTQYGELYNEDAVVFLMGLESGSVDLIFADPPYNIKKAEWDSFASQKEYVDWSLQWIKEAQRILTKKGSLYVCGFSEILADIKWAAAHLFKGCKWLVWFYRNKGNLGNDWGRSHESILHFRKSEDFIFNIDEVRIPYNQHTLKYPQRTQAVSSHFSNGKKSNYVWEPNPLGQNQKTFLKYQQLQMAHGKKLRIQHKSRWSYLKKLFSLLQMKIAL